MAKKKPPVKKNDIVTLSFQDLTHEGNGVGKVEGYSLFVPGGLPGEEAKVKVVRANKNFGYGILLELITESPERVEPTHDCGGCRRSEERRVGKEWRWGGGGWEWTKKEE